MNKLLGFFVLFSIMAMGTSVAYADISAYQDNIPEVQHFLDIVGELRAQGIYISYTVDHGITYLTNPIVEAYGETSASARQDNPPEIELFLKLRSAGEWVSYTYGIGITWLSQPLVEAAWGEELTIITPFNPQSFACTLTTNSTNFKEFDCKGIWAGEDHLVEGEERTPAQDGCPSGMDIDIRIDECRPFKDIQTEARLQCDADPECPSGYYNPTIVDPQMPDEDSDRPDDKELIKKINSLLADVKCYQGFGTTDGIQEVRHFPIPVKEIQKFVDGKAVMTYELDLSTPQTPIQIRGYYATIVKAAFECHAQDTLQNDQGGILSSADRQLGYCDRYAETLTVDQSVQAGCGMTSGSYYKSLHADIPVMTQDMANQRSNFGVDMSNNLFDIVEDVCEGYYTNSYKMTFKECREIRDSKIVRSGGHIPDMEIQNDSEDAANQYKLDGGKSAVEKLIKAKFAEEMRDLFNKMQQFKQQYGGQK